MDVREEDRQKSSCTGRNLGIIAAVGVGVGAAMYYFFSNRPENPHNEGSTSDWNCERPATFHPLMDSEDSYTTVSEHDTTDTSINQTVSSDNVTDDDNDTSVSEDDDEESPDSDESMDDSDASLNGSNHYNSPSTNSNMSLDDMIFDDSSPETHMGDMTFDTSAETADNVSGDTTFNENLSASFLGDMTADGSEGSDSDLSLVEMSYEQYVDDYDIMTPVLQAFDDLKRLFDIRSGKTQDEQAKLINLRQQTFRERTWTLEECSICFDVMLRDQELMALSCTHNFHAGCILPWLQEKQTCPVCRKAVE